jgi:hypothetical protein
MYWRKVLHQYLRTNTCNQKSPGPGEDRQLASLASKPSIKYQQQTRITDASSIPCINYQPASFEYVKLALNNYQLHLTF